MDIIKKEDNSLQTDYYFNSAKTGSSKITFIATERDLAQLDKDEPPLVEKSDNLCSYSLVDACVALAKSHTYKDALTDTPCHSVIRLLKLHECKNLEHEEDEGNSPKSFSDYADFISYYSYTYQSRNFAGDVTNEEKILQLQICENKNVAICGGETKGQVNKNSMSKHLILPVTECVEVSVVAYNGVLAKSSATENECLETDDLCGVKGEHAAAKTIVNARNEMADHTTEAQISARISQEPAEGDNNAGIFSVIEPAVRIETDSEAKEESCNSKSTPGVELSPSIKACEMETPLSTFFIVRPSEEPLAPNQTGQFNYQSTTQQNKSGRVDIRLSFTETQACSISTSETHNSTGNQGNMPHGPVKTLPAGHVRQEIRKTVGNQSKKRDHCFAVSLLDNLKKRCTEQAQVKIARLDGTTGTKERKEIKSFEQEIQIGVHRKVEQALESTKRNLQRNEPHEEIREISYSDCIRTERGSSEFDRRLTLRDQHKKTDCFSGHLYSGNMCKILDVTVDKKSKNMTNVGEEMEPDKHQSQEIVVNLQDLQQQIEYKTDVEASHVERVGDCAESQMSTSANKLILLIQHEEGSHRSDCPDYQSLAKTCMVENTSNLMDFTSALTSDAVVPCLNGLSHSQNANSKSTSSNCSGRFPPVPSAFSLHDRMQGGFDSFEKIHLSQDDDDNYYAGPNNKPFLTSLPQQLLNTPQRHIMPGAETKDHDPLLEDVEEEEEDRGEKGVEGSECHPAYMANGVSNCDTKCKELPNVTSAADVVAVDTQSNGGPIQGDLNTETKSSTGFTKSYSSACGISSYPEFEMKKHFDVVLKELSLFFNISISDFGSSRASSAEQRHDTAQPSGAEIRKDHLRNKDLGCPRHISEPGELEQKRKTWSPSFMCPPLLEQLSCGPEQLKRLKPLRTCTRPIRIGLSKKAKTKHLHRPHPYK